MTKQEIKDLVAAKLVGQGNQVDLGGALPAILDGIIDLIQEPAPSEVLVVKDTDLIANTPDWQAHSIIKVLAEGSKFVTILPVSTNDVCGALYQYYSEWRIVDSNLNIETIDEWSQLCDYLDEHSKPVAVRESVTLDLSEYTLTLGSAEEVTDAIPADWIPSVNDKLVYNGTTYLFAGATINSVRANDGALFGYLADGDSADKISLYNTDNKWYALWYSI